jgi:hypothetical protein
MFNTVVDHGYLPNVFCVLGIDINYFTAFSFKNKRDGCLYPHFDK